MKYTRFLTIVLLLAGSMISFQPAAAQASDNDILVMEYGYLLPLNMKSYGIYIYWPDKEMEFIQIKPATKADEVLELKKTIYKKVNEISDVGWTLFLVDFSSGNNVYFFKKTETE